MPRTEKKKSWSIGFLSAPLLVVTPPPTPSQSESDLDPTIIRKKVGIHTAQLTDGRRLQSRATSHAMKIKQSSVAGYLNIVLEHETRPILALSCCPLFDSSV